MPNLATWLRAKDEKWFQPFFASHAEIQVRNARTGEVNIDEAGGLLLTGGSDVAPEFLRQAVPDRSLIEDVDLARDRWEFGVIPKAITRGLPIFAICRGIQVLNVALGGTLKLDIPGHRAPEMKTEDVQPLRNDRAARHRFEKVNSAHHQALDSLGEGLVAEAWCATDDIIEQVRLRGYPFALGVQYHPERGKIYDALFEDFFARLNDRRSVEALKRKC
jgi:putative glutamine amidotransferase